MTPLRLAVVGVGSLGRHHARILAGLEDVDLIGVVDPNQAQAASLAQQYGTTAFADASELPGGLDGIVVAAPTRFHEAIATPLLAAGIPLMIEKPLASSLAEARRLQQLAESSGTMLQVGHVEQFNPAFRELRSRCAAPLYIKLQRTSPFSFRSMDIGVVHDLMIHDLDLSASLLEEDDGVTRVESFGAITIGPHEDVANARLTTRNGVIIDLVSSRMNPAAERSIQVWTESGVISADLQARSITDFRPAQPFRTHPQAVHDRIRLSENPLALKDDVFSTWVPPETVQCSDADALTAELRDFIDSIRSGRSPRVPGMHAVRAMEWADLVLQNMRLWSYQEGTAMDHPSTVPAPEERRAA